MLSFTICFIISINSFTFSGLPLKQTDPWNRPLDGPLDKPKPPKPSAKVQKRTHNQNEFHEKTVEIDEIHETEM